MTAGQLELREETRCLLVPPALQVSSVVCVHTIGTDVAGLGATWDPTGAPAGTLDRKPLGRSNRYKTIVMQLIWGTGVGGWEKRQQLSVFIVNQALLIFPHPANDPSLSLSFSLFLSFVAQSRNLRKCRRLASLS